MNSGETRIGFGEDSHRLVVGRPLRLGGVTIEESELGSDAHSDGDVLLHALSDALLSAFALGDIGQMFPPTDPAHLDKPGEEIVRAVLERLRPVTGGGLRVVNVAAVVTLDRPKLGPRRDEIAAKVASLLALDVNRVGLTFKTSEGALPSHVQARVALLLRGA